MVSLLLNRGALTDFRLATTGETPLHSAVKTGSWIITQELLRKGADPNTRDRWGCTPLITTVLQERTTSPDELPADGASPSVRKHNGTMLFIVKSLLEAHANVNARNDAGWTALYAAAYTPDINNVGVAEYLLTHHAAVNLCADDGTTPLHIIIRRHARALGAMPDRVRRLVSLLLEHGADANLKAVNGLTPLHEAVWSWDEMLVSQLLKHGARTDIQNNLQQTAIDYARIRFARRLQSRRRDADNTGILRLLNIYNSDNGLPTTPATVPEPWHTAMLTRPQPSAN